MQMNWKVLVALCAAFVVATAGAQVPQARGVGTVRYDARSATPEAKASALQIAQMNAIEHYYAEAGESEAQNFDSMRAKIAENPERYILDVTVLSENDNTGSKAYTVSVRASLNLANLRNDLKAQSAVGKATRSERSALAFLFVSREIDTQRTFDPRVSKRRDDSVTVDGSRGYTDKGVESESVRSGRVATNDSRTQTIKGDLRVSQETETGGSTLRRSSQSTWRLFPSANLNQVFTQSFTRAGFKVNEAAQVEPYTGGRFRVAQVEDDYRNGNDLQSSTLLAITQGMRNAQIPYVAFGTLDVGLADRDPSTGNSRVAVTVNAKILDVTSTIPDTIASVGPVQYAGVGATEEEARVNALKLAANSAARELTSQVTNLGLK